MDFSKTFIDDLCQYYNIDYEQATKLGVRSDGRKPSLPGSETCSPVKNMTLGDIWAAKPRNTEEDIFQFYRDQGAWSAFRQVVRHIELIPAHHDVWNSFVTATMGLARPLHIVEYGCGVAPWCRTFIETLTPFHENLEISISDIDECEHFLFANWRLNNIVSKRNLNVTVHSVPVVPHKLPQYVMPIDFVILFEVLEHVPNPINVIKNLYEQMRKGATLLENFIQHEPGDDGDGPDLSSAAEERAGYYKFLHQNFTIVYGDNEIIDPNSTRVWQKK